MARRNTLVLVAILALFAVAVQLVFPLQGERPGRQVSLEDAHDMCDNLELKMIVSFAPSRFVT